MGSLFSGIGGLELGLEAAGFGPVAWQVEIDPFCRQVLAKHWPDADRSVIDVRLAGPDVLARVNLICGGFPCQDVSSAGKGAGLDGERSGLWKEYRRVLEELRPDFAVVENVASGKGRWLCAVRRDLHELGYDTAALAISSADIGAPHRRSRIFVVAALANGNGNGNGQRQPGGPILDERRGTTTHRASGDCMGHPDRINGPQGHAFEDCREATGQARRTDRGLAESRVGRDADGLSARLDGHLWPAGRGPDQHAHEAPRTIPSRSCRDRAKRVKGLGNAVSPQCALAAGRYLRALLETA